MFYVCKPKVFIFSENKYFKLNTPISYERIFVLKNLWFSMTTTVYEY